LKVAAATAAASSPSALAIFTDKPKKIADHVVGGNNPIYFLYFFIRPFIFLRGERRGRSEGGGAKGER
jgi:hypothetical protein